jgi:hypothetical protein
MKIHKRVKLNWKALYEFGDIALIHNQTGISRTTISNALNSNQTSEKTYEAIKAYYNKKAIEVNKQNEEELKSIVFINTQLSN